MRTASILPSMLLLLSSSVHAAEPEPSYAIRLKLFPSSGKMVTINDQSKDSGTIRYYAKDQEKPGFEMFPNGQELVAQLTVFESGKSGRPTKYLRHYEKSNKTENKKLVADSYEGKTLLFEYQPMGKHRIGIVEDAEIAQRDYERLLKKMNYYAESELVYQQFSRDNPVKVGETWKIDIKPLAEALDFSIDEKESAGTVKLVSVNVQDKTPVGKLEFQVRLHLKSMKIDPVTRFKFEKPGIFKVSGTVEIAIDGSSTARSDQVSLSFVGVAKSDQADSPIAKIDFDTASENHLKTSSESPAKLTEAPKVRWLPAPGDWVKWTPKGFPITADLPGNPKRTEGKNNSITWTVEFPEKKIVYAIAITDFSKVEVDVKKVYEKLKTNYKDAKVKEYDQDMKPAIQIDFEDKAQGLDYFMKVCMSEGVMYHMMYIVEKGKANAEDREKFFKSVKISESPKK